MAERQNQSIARGETPSPAQPARRIERVEPAQGLLVHARRLPRHAPSDRPSPRPMRRSATGTFGRPCKGGVHANVAHVQQLARIQQRDQRVRLPAHGVGGAEAAQHAQEVRRAPCSPRAGRCRPPCPCVRRASCARGRRQARALRARTTRIPASARAVAQNRPATPAPMTRASKEGDSGTAQTLAQLAAAARRTAARRHWRPGCFRSTMAAAPCRPGAPHAHHPAHHAGLPVPRRRDRHFRAAPCRCSWASRKHRRGWTTCTASWRASTSSTGFIAFWAARNIATQGTLVYLIALAC